MAKDEVKTETEESKIPNSKNNKKARRELAKKRAKRKKIIIIALSAVIAVAVVTAIVIGAVNSARTQTYTDGHATITLHSDGSFTATMYHGERYNGTYLKTDESVEFTYGGATVSTLLDGNRIHIPNEWEDGHNHGSVLIKR